ncbi:MAG TPA: MFS transporter [Candidatus Dormibacteraeota bacterium]|nr:MFS transporter [Candidatus Dormibacteraeota bacterium]
MIELDRRQRVTLTWAAIALVITAFEGSVLVIALPAVATEFHANTPALSDLLSVLAIGTLGALPLSTLADKFGRKRLIAVGVAGSSLANLASGFAPSIAVLAFFKIFAVCFEVLVGGVVTALIVEEAPAEHRGAAVSVIALLSGAGIFVVVVAYPLVAPHWRWLFYAGGVGVLVAPFIWWLLPESKAWERVEVTGSALRLLMQRPWRRRMLILSTMTGLLAVLLDPAGLLYTVYASFVLHWSTVAISILVVVSGIAAAVSYLAGGYLTDRFGRRGPAVALAVSTAAATSLSFATGSIGFFVGNVLWSAFASAGTPVFGAWSGELFPTRARATAEAAIAVISAVGGIVGLQAVALLSGTTGLGGAIQLGGVVAVAGALLLFLLPETKQQPLPE